MGSSSLTRDGTWAPCIGKCGVLATGPPGRPPGVLFRNNQLGCSGDGGSWDENQGRWVPGGVNRASTCDPCGCGSRWGGSAGRPGAPGEQGTKAWAGGPPWHLGLRPLPPLLTPERLLSGPGPSCFPHSPDFWVLKSSGSLGFIR